MISCECVCFVSSVLREVLEAECQSVIQRRTKSNPAFVSFVDCLFVRHLSSCTAFQSCSVHSRDRRICLFEIEKKQFKRCNNQVNYSLYIHFVLSVREKRSKSGRLVSNQNQNQRYVFGFCGVFCFVGDRLHRCNIPCNSSSAFCHYICFGYVAACHLTQPMNDIASAICASSFKPILDRTSLLRCILFNLIDAIRICL